ncbi:MAG: hypothetical protein K2X03_03010 [Bryobacteraceae bacterium]|nr:hypothetical protein [Bryobacteraceae bacterium]
MRRPGSPTPFAPPGDDAAGLYSVSVRPAGDGLEFGVPVKLFELSQTFTGYFAVSPDGQKFYTNQGADQSAAARPNGGQVTVILNWAAGLKN